MKKRRLTIFEGPDAAGKTTLARAYCQATGAHYVHLGPFPGVSQGNLARFYAEAMAPALLGLADVVMDRSWLSEPVYGKVFRRGSDRVGKVGQRLLERGAMGADAVVVLCLPPYERVMEAFFARRKTDEVPKGGDDLADVWNLYREASPDTASWTSLPGLTVNPFTAKREGMWRVIEGVCGERYNVSEHPTSLPLGTYGSPLAGTVVVASGATVHTDQCPLVRWPGSFGSLAQREFTNLLESGGVEEADVAWVDALAFEDAPDDDVGALSLWLKDVASVNGPSSVIPVGDLSGRLLERLGVGHADALTRVSPSELASAVIASHSASDKRRGT